MPQLFHVIRCCDCRMFQVQQAKKSSNKWTCCVCGTKQSIKKVYGEGSSSICRTYVQSLNIENANCQSPEDMQTNGNAASSFAENAEVQSPFPVCETSHNTLSQSRTLPYLNGFQVGSYGSSPVLNPTSQNTNPSFNENTSFELGSGQASSSASVNMEHRLHHGRPSADASRSQPPTKRMKLGCTTQSSFQLLSEAAKKTPAKKLELWADDMET